MDMINRSGTDQVMTQTFNRRQTFFLLKYSPSKLGKASSKTCLFISSSYLASSQMHPPTIFSPAQNDHGSVFMYFHAGQQEIVRQPLVWLWFKMWAHLFWTHHLCITCRIWNFQLQSRPPMVPVSHNLHTGCYVWENKPSFQGRGISVKFELFSVSLGSGRNISVDGRNPAPPGM